MPILEREQYDLLFAEDRIWRYMSFPQFLNFLRTGNLLFRRVGNFGDPYEGAIPKSLEQLRGKVYEESEQEYPEDFGSILSAQNEFMRKLSYANCWHMNKAESAAMWEHYGEKGIAITSSTDAIYSSFEDTDKKLFARPVQYLNYHDNLEELSEEEKSELQSAAVDVSSELVSTLFLKRKSFQHENELRVVFTNISFIPEEEYEEMEYNILVNGEKRKVPIFTRFSGQSGAVDFRDIPDADKREIGVDVVELVDEIRVSPGAGDWFLNTIKDAVNHLGPMEITADDVKRSATDQNSPIF